MATVRRGAWAGARSGLTLDSETAQQIAEIIRDMTGAGSVVVAGRSEVLGCTGPVCARHEPGLGLDDPAVQRALSQGDSYWLDRASLRPPDCAEGDCPCRYETAVIAPLRHRGQLWGYVKLYDLGERLAPDYVARLVPGISGLVSLAIERMELNRQREWEVSAHLEALQAQIRPHFLFNTLNTILSATYEDVAVARQLIMHLAEFFRRTLTRRSPFIRLSEEIDYLRHYLRLEQARYGGRLQVQLLVDTEATTFEVPPLVLQPLVENAVLHGIAPREEGGRIVIKVRRRRRELHLTVFDSGVGMDITAKRHVSHTAVGRGTGLGLDNINDRLRALYGEKYRLRIWTRPGRGTLVLVRIPLKAAQRRERA